MQGCSSEIKAGGWIRKPKNSPQLRSEREKQITLEAVGSGQSRSDVASTEP